MFVFMRMCVCVCVRVAYAWVQITGGRKFYWGRLAMDPAPPEKPAFSPHTFCHMMGLTRLIVTISFSTFFPKTEIGNCGLKA